MFIDDREIDVETIPYYTLPAVGKFLGFCEVSRLPFPLHGFTMSLK
jgi:hypothetical protein